LYNNTYDLISGWNSENGVSVMEYEVLIDSRHYDVSLHPDLEDGSFWLECPELPGCASQGDTIEEALEMIKDAIKGHLEVETKR